MSYKDFCEKCPNDYFLLRHKQLVDNTKNELRPLMVEMQRKSFSTYSGRQVYQILKRIDYLISRELGFVTDRIPPEYAEELTARIKGVQISMFDKTN